MIPDGSSVLLNPAALLARTLSSAAHSGVLSDGQTTTRLPLCAVEECILASICTCHQQTPDEESSCPGPMCDNPVADYSLTVIWHCFPSTLAHWQTDCLPFRLVF